MAQNQLGFFISSCRVEPIIQRPRAELSGTTENSRKSQANSAVASPRP